MFSSAWDAKSVKFLKEFDEIIKVPSAKITDINLLKAIKKHKFRTVILSTGMSTEEEIEKVIPIVEPDVIMHTNSCYPTPASDLYLDYISWLMSKYNEKEIGYSSHFFGLLDVFPAIGKGATWVEKHICENHTDWGSDQSSSVEPHGFLKMCKSIHELELSCFEGNYARKLLPGEEIKKKALR